MVQVGYHSLPDGGGAGAHEGVIGLKAGMQERVGFSAEIADSDIGEGITSGHETLAVGGGSGQRVCHLLSKLFSSNGVPDSGGKAR